MIKILELENKIRNTLNRFNSRLYIERINELEGKSEVSRMKHTKGQHIQKRRDTEYTMKRSNRRLTVVPEGQQKKRMG